VPLVALESVLEEVLAGVTALPAVDVPLAEALGLALAADVISPEQVPPFDNSAMDGYAVRAADTAGAAPDRPVVLRVVGELPAGRAPSVAVEAGTAIRIMTGAPMPPGADSIVMVERTEAGANGDVKIRGAATLADHVRRAGGDLEAGRRVFAAGTVLGAAHIGVLASIDVQRVRVHRRARVGVLSTGDELVEQGALAPGKIRDSNRPMLRGLVGGTGAEVVDLGIARDDEDLITKTLDDAFDRCDVVLTSGGVSVGDYDYAKAALDRLAARDGGSFGWRQVAIKPAKPLAFGTVRGVPVFGLPGNPVSSLVSFEVFARPAILQRMGHPNRFRPVVTAIADHELRRRADGKVHLDRVKVAWRDGSYRVASAGAQESNVLSATAAANGLALLPDGTGITAGGAVEVMLLDAPADH
jgi:molybdopterin molybdotransferase